MGTTSVNVICWLKPELHKLSGEGWELEEWTLVHSKIIEIICWKTQYCRCRNLGVSEARVLNNIIGWQWTIEWKEWQQMGIASKRSCVAGKHQKKQADTCDRKCNVCFNTCAYQIIMTNDNERFQLLLSWCYSWVVQLFPPMQFIMRLKPRGNQC